MATAKEVAQYMLDRLEQEHYLYQDVVVYEIESRFGDKFIYLNENGNIAISREVLREFRKLTEVTVVWERGERLWRKRSSSDPKGTRQVY